MSDGITVTFEYPPVPIRHFDYRAVRTSACADDDGAEGWGCTPEQAIADLLAQEEAGE